MIFGDERSGTRQRGPFLPLCWTLYWRPQPGQLGRKRKIEGIQIRKEEVKTPLFANNRILYIGNPKESIKKKRKLVELTKQFNKVTGYKVNIQKHTKKYFYISNEQSQREVFKNSTYNIINIIKCLGINLIKKSKTYILKPRFFFERNERRPK